jgi:hypothetical protein
MSSGLWVALGLVAFFAIALPLLAVYLAVADWGADEIADVERFVELTDAARRSLPPGLPLLESDREAATTDAIVHFQAKKEEARRALWAASEGKRRAA